MSIPAGVATKRSWKLPRFQRAVSRLMLAHLRTAFNALPTAHFGGTNPRRKIMQFQ
jgi:hypothetical protein